jgi:putative FmdB family regulatory protein
VRYADGWPRGLSLGIAVPTYDYQCRSCGFITEVVHSMLDEGPTACERCGRQLRRVIHPSGIIFKGGGFYKTDSRPSASGSGAGASKGGSQSGKEGGDHPKPSSDAPSTDKGSTPAPTAGGAGKSESGGD